MAPCRALVTYDAKKIVTAYAKLAEQHRTIDAEYKKRKIASRNLLVARTNAEKTLGIKSEDLKKSYGEIISEQKAKNALIDIADIYRCIAH